MDARVKADGAFHSFFIGYWRFPFIEIFDISFIWYICIEICRYEAKVKQKE